MILEVLVTSTVLIAGIFCLRKLTLGKISMRLRYGLWLLVAVRLLLPLSVGTSAFSVMNLLPGILRENAGAFPLERENSGELPANGGRDLTYVGERDDTFSGGQNEGEEPAGMKTGNGIMSAAADHAAQGEVVSDKRFRSRWAFSRRRLVITVWLVGFLAAGGYMLFCRQRFVRCLYRNRRELPAETAPDALTERLSQRGMKVYQVKGLPGPCLVGRHIYIGEETATQPQQLTHVLAHEYCHALHGDGLWAFLRCFLAAVYWFDPFVWAAAYAARRDSELACDEAAVKLLGEPCRFDYGRTLLALLENAGGGEKCPGMTFMTEGGERGVRERITALARKSRTKKPVLAAVLAAVVLVCGCAFTGAERNGVNSAGETDGQGVGGSVGSAGDGVGKQGTENAAAQNREMVSEENNEEFARIQKEYEETVKTAELVEAQGKELEERAQQEADRAAFQDMLSCYSAMEESGNREFDIQSYYDWKEGKGGEKSEDGWYLLCREDGGLIHLYGLYTEDFGFRGLKLRIGQDETTLDIPWCASYLNGISENIRILEYAENRAPRRFVWKLLVEESSTKEIWRLYSGFRYDTGTIDLRTLTAEECVEWAKEHLSFEVDRETAEIDVTYDGDMYLGAIDISAYRDWETEDVQIASDAVAFTLADLGETTLHYDGDAGDYQTYSDTAYEGMAVYLTAGLKFRGVEGLWYDGLPLLTIQAVEDENSDSGFRLERPRIDQTYVANAPFQEKKLSELRDGKASAQADDAAGGGRNDLEKPLENGTEAHYDVEIIFSNPCPDSDRISDWYGERINPATGVVRTHTGVDIAAPEGADILAAADGTASMTGFDAVNGNYVVLWHVQSGQMTYYTHCKTVEVEKGQQVARGEKIATVGKTGAATGPCLHFAVSSGRNWEEPYWEELDE